MTDHDIRALTAKVRAFNELRDWSQFHDPKNLAMALASEVGELNALLRWVRNEDSDAAVRGDLRDQLIAELGDVGILLLSLCDRAGVDLVTAIESKLRLNDERYPVDVSHARAERPR